MSKNTERLQKKYVSATHYVLSALVPYTEANLKLAFKPNQFFNDLDTLGKSNASKESIKTAYYRLLKKDLIQVDTAGIPRLTQKGTAQLVLYEPTLLPKGAKLLLIFDVPEIEKAKRNHLRTLLRQLKFEQIQRSVWQTKYDSIDYLRSEIVTYGLQEYVRVYESSELHF
ncbi:hypothetical protein KBD87_03955 [Candidatus Saccharibacteria bacterium]|nr:hypothetical protein [Candidatus Saccharibacteria bacterium]